MARTTRMGNGRKIDRYEVIREIARSNDVVYEGWDPRMSRRVAIKELLPPAGASHVQIQDRIQRFEREARAAGSLSHPGVVTVYDFLTVGEDRFLVMELVSGETLDAVLKSRTFSSKEVRSIAAQVLAALGYAHSKGIVHRDVKPANCFLLSDGTVKLADFGIARIDYEPSVTATGQAFGTPDYMSPEQARGGTLDGRSDLWAAGVMVYELSTGQKPFSGGSVMDTLDKVLRHMPDFGAVYDPTLREFCRRCLQKDPGARFQTTQEAIDSLGSDQRTLTVMVTPQAPAKPNAVTGRRFVPLAFLAALAVAVSFYAGREAQIGKPLPPVQAKTKPLEEILLAVEGDARLERLFSSTEMDHADAAGRMSLIESWLEENPPEGYATLSSTVRSMIAKAIYGSYLKGHDVASAPNEAPAASTPKPTDPLDEIVSKAAERSKREDSTHDSEGGDSRNPWEVPDEPVDPPRRERTKPPAKTPPKEAGTFTIGSSAEDVRRVMGTPREIMDLGTAKILYFGSSSVQVDDTGVTSFNNRGELKVRWMPQSNTGAKSFGEGSNLDEVLECMGTPREVMDLGTAKILYYGSSSVQIDGGGVTSYTNRGELKLKAS